MPEVGSIWRPHRGQYSGLLVQHDPGKTLCLPRRLCSVSQPPTEDEVGCAEKLGSHCSISIHVLVSSSTLQSLLAPELPYPILFIPVLRPTVLAFPYMAPAFSPSLTLQSPQGGLHLAVSALEVASTLICHDSQIHDPLSSSSASSAPLCSHEVSLKGENQARIFAASCFLATGGLTDWWAAFSPRQLLTAL